jgi:hypothetical protein
MEWGRLLALLPLAYIIWWFYTLFIVIIPWLNIAIGETLSSMTWLQIVGIVFFFSLGIVGLIFAFIFFVMILVA